MFERFSDKIQTAMRRLRGIDKISEGNITEALADVRDAFLEADVSFEVIKSFLESVRAKSLGEKVLKSIAPGQQLIKIIHDSLLELLGSEEKLSAEKPLRTMLVGLHGSGKTTSAVKLANYLRQKGYRPLLIACDVHRPAAIDQLESLAAEVNLSCYVNRNSKNPEHIAKEALKYAENEGFNALIFDTAGRLQIDGPLVEEIRQLKKMIQPQEIFLVADSALGQEAVAVAETFHGAVQLTGILLTKLDGDSRGGAALSMKYATGVPIKFMGMGERVDDFDIFHPQGMVQRILGMGDVVALVERAQNRVDREEAERLAKRFKKAQFDFNDFLSQMEQIEKMGSMGALVRLLPGMNNAQISPKELAMMDQSKAIIRAMTREEREKPSLVNGNRKLRIAKGSGVEVRDVNHVLKQFEMMQKSMKMMKKSQGKKMLPSMSSAGAMEQLGKLLGGKL